jgi:pimeloyl-ACP methyl ester carboxylesterase
MATRYATTNDGVNIAYIRVGDGPPIVFAANNCDALNHSYPEFQGLTDGLADFGWEVVLHDMRGAGASDRDVVDWGLEARVRDLETVVACVGAEPFVLAAIDHGCPTAIAYATRHPERVSHLVLLCPWARGADHFAYPPVRQATSPRATSDAEWTVHTNIIGGVLTEFIDPARQRQIADAIRTNTSAANFAAANKAAEATDVSDLLGAVCAPTLILFDSTFPFASFDLCRRVASGIPNARLVMMHESFMIGPRHEQTVATIEQFLREGVISEQPVEPVSYARATLTQRERKERRYQSRDRSCGYLRERA